MATVKNDVTGEMFEKNFDNKWKKKKPSDDVSPHLHEYELNKPTGEEQKVCECGVKGCE